MHREHWGLWPQWDYKKLIVPDGTLDQVDPLVCITFKIIPMRYQPSKIKYKGVVCESTKSPMGGWGKKILDSRFFMVKTKNTHEATALKWQNWRISLKKCAKLKNNPIYPWLGVPRDKIPNLTLPMNLNRKKLILIETSHLNNTFGQFPSPREGS